MDIRGLQVNKDIYQFETMVFKMADILPKKLRYSLVQATIESTMNMRLHTNLACRSSKFDKQAKYQYFALALGYAYDTQDCLDHLYDLMMMSLTAKAKLDMSLDGIIKSLEKLQLAFAKEIQKGQISQDKSNEE